MLKFIRIRLAERRFDRMTGECIAYSRRPLDEWHVTVQCAMNSRRDAAAAAYAAALAA